MCRTVLQGDIDKALKMHYNKHTVAAYRSAMKHLLGKQMCLDEIQGVVASWGNLAASTIYQRKAAVNWLIAVMGSGAEKGLADNLRYPKGRPRKPRSSLSGPQLEGVLAAINTTRERLLVTVLLHTGLRIGSVAKLTYDHLASESFLLETKGGTVVEIFPTASLRELAQATMVARGAARDSYVFPSGNGGLSGTKELYRTFKRVAARAGFPKLTPHNMRHTFATTLGRSAPLSVVSELMGHKNISTTALYVHPGRNDLRAAMDRAGQEWK